MKDTKYFYEEYWKEREKTHRLYVLPEMWVPPRITIAALMIIESIKSDKMRDGKRAILDVGCGEGILGKTLRESGKQGTFRNELILVGVDISDTALRHATKYYDKLFRANIELDEWTASLGGEMFDYVVCLEILEHLFEPKAVLQQIRKVMKPNAYLIASFPNIAFWRYRLDLLRGKVPRGYTLYHPAEHIQNFTLNSFRQLLLDAGFRVVELEGQRIYPKFLRPRRLFDPILRRFLSLFGYQIVIKAQVSEEAVDKENSV